MPSPLSAVEIKFADFFDVQVKLVDLLLQYFVLFHSRLDLTLLDRGYRAMFPDAMLSNKTSSPQSSDEGQDLLTCKDSLLVSCRGIASI